MRILYVSQYFPPEVNAPAARVHELAREWVRLGHHVSVITGFPHHPLGCKAPHDRGVLSRREALDGIDLIRTYVYAVPNEGKLRRMLSYASFMLSAATIGYARTARPDVVVATSPHLLSGLAGYLLARAMGVPFVFEVRDLWPEQLLAIGIGREGSMVVRVLRRLARFLYEHSDHMVTVGDGYAHALRTRHQVPPTKLSVIPNGIDPSLFVPGERMNAVRAAHGWGDRFVVLYLGTHGLSQGLGSVLEVAAQLRDEKDILFAFVGEGADKAALQERACQEGLSNVQFIGQQPKQLVPGYYSACDLGVVALRPAPLFTEVLPSKLFEYLGMEKPVLLNIDGEARRLVERAGCGGYVPWGDAAGMAQMIRNLRGQRDQLVAMGRSGRRFVLEKYERRVLAKTYLTLLQKLAQTEPLANGARPEPAVASLPEGAALATVSSEVVSLPDCRA